MTLIIDPALPQWKGNLHCHTTLSDGLLPPREAAALYQAAGYDFLAITDHRRVTDPAEAETDLLLIPGIELDYRVMGRHMQAVHILGIGVDGRLMDEPQVMADPQQGIDLIRSHGGLAIFAHPAWSLSTPETIEALRGISAAEIYNHVSDAPWNAPRGDSSLILDECFADGCLLPVVAGDDAHHYNGDQCHSAVIVCAEACTREGILSALAQGHVYASQGPRITDMCLEDGVLSLSCSPCRQIVFYSNMFYGRGRVLTGADMTRAAYRVQPAETFVRVEIMDEQGLRAWSSPVRL
ncbi:MAG: CehA/McbA family metallohydrolase [Clostridia bacterium]|nr:CehA/McbA family metallohydrolase [Clostridia bacterium]